MAPGAKRKRGDSSHPGDGDGSNRPSPHRPGNLGMAQRFQDHPQQNRSNAQNQYGQRGGRRPSRGGRGGAGSNAASPVEGSGSSLSPRDGGRHFSNTGTQDSQTTQASPSASTAMSPPQPPPTNQSSKAQSASTTTIESPAPPQITPTEPARPPAPYAYEYLTEEQLNDWTTLGKDAVVGKAIDSLHSGDFLSLSLIYQELIRAGLDKKLDPAAAGGAVEEILRDSPPGSTLDGSSAFLDTLSILTDSDTSNPLLRPLVQATNIPLESMREQLEEPLLQSLGLIRSTFAKVFIRKQTNILYRQSNYNLLREESEGYSKLLTELFTRSSSAPTAATVEDVYENTKALIGAFDLDAGRVLDVTLDVFASVLVKFPRFFAKFLRTSSFWPQQQNFGIVRTESQGFTGLPRWAEPGHSHWDLSEDEAVEFAHVKEERDKRFWQRAREVGVDAYFELGCRKLVGDQELPELLAEVQSDNARAVETRKWVATTRTLPPVGNDVAAQLLGFKLRFYASQARDARDVLPVNLIYLAALLIKIGFISLRDLYTHLYPTDDEMGSVKEKQVKVKEEREKAKRPGGNVPNALERAGALADDSIPGQPQLPAVSRLREGEVRSGTPSKSDTASSKAGTPAAKTDEDQEDKDADIEQLPAPADQKVQLLRSLLCIGALPEALYMLGRFPWLLEAFPDLPDHVNRILHHSLTKVYDELRPLRDRNSCKDALQYPEKDQSGLTKGELRLADSEKIKSLRWALLEKRDVNDGNDYRFYWDDWADNIPVCQSVDDVFTLCSTFLNLSGVKIGQDPSLLLKIVRIGKSSLAEDGSESNTSRWYDLCKRLLCPALSMTRSNPGTVNEVWDILKLFSTKQRYAVYSEWFGGQISRLQDMQDCFNLVKFETRAVMKRMSTENTKLMARQLAKVACASPGVVFEVVLNQIQSYPNLTDTVVECGRYFTYMGYDVLTWSVMRALGNPNRDRLTDTGFEASPWLQHLAEFCGKIFKRYSMMSPLPVLQYVLDQLRKDNFVDLRVFKDLLWYMAGIVAGVEFNDKQVEAMGGGQTLVSVTLKQVLDNRHMSKASSKRLLKIMADHRLLGPYLIAIAQQRQLSIFKAEHNSLKIVSENFDSLTNIFWQYLDFIITNLSTKDSDVILPSITELIADYGVPAELAFAIHRRSLGKAISDYDAEHGTRKTPTTRSIDEKLKTSGDVEMIDAASPEDSADNSALEAVPEAEKAATVEEKTTEEVADESVNVAGTTSNATMKPEASPVHPILQEVVENIPRALPDNFATCLSVSFYVRFWQLSLYDLTAPTTSYSDETFIQEAKRRNIINNRSDLSVSGMKRKDGERQAVDEFITRLHDEVKNQVRDLQHTQRRLKEENKEWFTGFSGKWQTLNEALLQYCFIPRMLLSSVDSYFTFKMIFQMHSAATPHFRTMHVIDRLLSENTLTNVIFSCSSREADNLGRFLYELLKRLNGWHADRTLYEKEAYGMKKNLPGFAQNISSDKPDRFLEFEDFRRLLYKWHRRLFDSLKVCLSNTEFMHISNAIKVLKRVSSVFPAVNWMGSHLSTQINEISSREKPEKDKPNKVVRNDIWVSANSVIAGLKQREKEWVMPQAFMLNDAPTKNTRGTGRSVSSAPKSPQPERSISKALDANAPAFSPKSSQTVNGDSKGSTTATGDVEDGEVEDGEAQSAKNKDSTKGISIEPIKKEQSVPPNPESAPPASQAPPNETESGSAEVKSPPAAHSATETLKTEAQANDAARASPATEARLKSDAGRMTSAPATPNRMPHTLPSRPEGPPPAHRNRHDASQPLSRPESRARQVPDLGKSDRPPDQTQNKPSDRSGSGYVRSENMNPSERSGQYSDRQRDGPRYYDRNGRLPPDDRAYRGPPRDARQPPLDRYGHHDYSDDPSSRPGSRGIHDVNRPPYPAPSGQQPQDWQDGYSQQAPYGSRHSMYDRTNPNHVSDIRRDRSRPQSPPRVESRASHASNQPPDDRSHAPASRPQPYDNRNPSTDYAPSGPRGNNRPSDSMQPPATRGAASERPLVRSNQDSSRPPRHQDINYGRLNADPIPPSAQGMRGVEDNAVSTGDQASVDQPPNTSTQSSRTPTGPAAQDRSQGGRRQTRSSATSETPAAPQSTTSQPPGDTSGVHPSRRALMEVSGAPPPIQTYVGPSQGSSSASAPSPSFANTPSGPRSAQIRGSESNANETSPTARNPPTGPANSERRRDQRTFANVQETLNQNSSTTPTAGNDRNGDRGASIRGRANASRQTQAPSDAPLGPSDPSRHNSQIQMQSQPLPQTVPQEEERSDQRERRGERSIRDDQTRDRERDSGKSSYRSSREHSRERVAHRDSDHSSRRGLTRGVSGQEDAAVRASRSSDRRSGRNLEGDLMQDTSNGPGGHGPPRNDRDSYRERDNQGGHHAYNHGYPASEDDDGYNRSRNRDDRGHEGYSRRGGLPIPLQSRHERELMPPGPGAPGSHQHWNGEGGTAGRGGSMRGAGRKRDWPGDGDQGYGGRMGEGKRPRRSGP